jgi:2-polyprenyl-3-methyl-5-hydroxy-6-metoxy-1,4-benzoquinol methylase
VCRHQKSRLVLECGKKELRECSKCGLIFSTGIFIKTDPTELYSDYYKNELQSGTGRFRFGLELIVKLFRFIRAFRISRLAPQAKSIFDIGCGRGWILYFLKKYYNFFPVTGTKISRPAYDFATKKLGLQIYDKDLLAIRLGKQKYDVVSIFHVLEHIMEPEKYLKKIYTMLTRDGLLIIEVPNYNSWGSALTGKYWLGLDLKYHLYFFTLPSLTKLVEKYGFKIVKIHTFSLEYSTFISVQSLIDKLTKTDQKIFRWLQGEPAGLWLLAHLGLFALLVIPCFTINVILYFSKKGEILLIVAKKNA